LVSNSKWVRDTELVNNTRANGTGLIHVWHDSLSWWHLPWWAIPNEFVTQNWWTTQERMGEDLFMCDTTHWVRDIYLCEQFDRSPWHEKSDDSSSSWYSDYLLSSWHLPWWAIRQESVTQSRCPTPQPEAIPQSSWRRVRWLTELMIQI